MLVKRALGLTKLFLSATLLPVSIKLELASLKLPELAHNIQALTLLKYKLLTKLRLGVLGTITLFPTCKLGHSEFGEYKNSGPKKP